MPRPRTGDRAATERTPGEGGEQLRGAGCRGYCPSSSVPIRLPESKEAASMRLSARVTQDKKVLKEVAFKLKRKGDVKRAVAKLVRRFRKGGGELFAEGTSIAAVRRARSKRPRREKRPAA